MRDVNIYSHPVAEPGRCCKCGSQDKDWFVDLGFDTEMYRHNVIEMDDPMNKFIDLPVWLDGIMYLCCDCINGLVADVARKFEVYKHDHSIEVFFNESRIDESVVGTAEDDSKSEPDDSNSPTGEEASSGFKFTSPDG